MQIIRRQSIESMQERGRVLLIFGPRRIGKTRLVKEYLASLAPHIRSRYVLGDDLLVQEFFKKQSRVEILKYIDELDVLVIDEAQLIPNIGMVAKIMIDEYPDKKIILTGSSSFDLAQQTGEPLVGRQYRMFLMPPAISEFKISNFDRTQQLNDFLIYGSYPEITLAKTDTDKVFKLQELVSSYLFKDILALDKIRSPELLLRIVRALAHQIGRQVSLTKLAKDIGESDPKKIARYVDLLEKTFIIRKVSAYSNNLRTGLAKNSKYYFYDLGVRNAVIADYKPLSLRSTVDVGHMWENYVVMELLKKSNINRQVYDELYFWRSKTGLEIDAVIQGINGQLDAYECKYGNELPSFTKFLEHNPQATTHVINRDNYLDYLS